GRTGVLDHGIEHLGVHDDRLGVLTGDLHHALLHERNLLEWNLHTEVTAGNHDRVEGQHDGFEGRDGLRLLQLGDDRDTTSLLVHDGMDEFDIRRGAHEGQGDEVNAEVQGETEILDVLLGQGGNGDVHARQGDTLVVGDGATFGDLADDVIALNGDADEADLAVIDQQAVSRAGIVGQVLVGGGHA